MSVWEYWFEIATSFVQVLTNALEDSEAAIEVSPKRACSHSRERVGPLHFDPASLFKVTSSPWAKFTCCIRVPEIEQAFLPKVD